MRELAVVSVEAVPLLLVVSADLGLEPRVPVGVRVRALQ